MPTQCNGKCELMDGVVRSNPKSKMYKKGYKRCQICEMYILWEGLWCPCCGIRLRSRSRYKMADDADKRGKRIAV